MATSNEMLQAVDSIQQNAQAALPVLPNNGNPMGANNMAPAGTMVGQEQAQPAPNNGYFYPWMQPSQHMTNIRQRLAARQTAMPPAPMQQPVPQVQPVMPQSMMPTQMVEQKLPVLPGVRTNAY